MAGRTSGDRAPSSVDGPIEGQLKRITSDLSAFSQARLDAAAERDEVAYTRDRAAQARDQAAEARDLEMVQHQEAAQHADEASALGGADVVLSATQQRQRMAHVREQAAEQRAQASQDRQSAAHDRDQASRERLRALVDREALARCCEPDVEPG